jgi:hypothetical protein
MLRRAFTTLVAIAFLVTSFGLLYYASSAQQDHLGSPTDDCPSNTTLYDSPSKVEEDSALVSCFCSTLSATQVVRETLCVSYVSEASFAAALALLSSSAVVIVNFALNIISKKLTAWEKHHSMESLARSLAVRLYISQFLNTAILLIVVNAYIPGLEDIMSGTKFRDFETKWYIVVGTAIITTMMINIFSIHSAPIGRYLAFLCRRRSKTFSQSELNRRQVGADFHLHIRFAQMTNTLSVTLLFSAGLPLLLPLVSVWMFVAYWVDKYLLLRYYRTPPRYGTEVAQRMLKLLLYPLLAHLAVAIWMLGNPHLFPRTESSVAELDALGDSEQLVMLRYRVEQAHVVPMFALLLLLLGVLIVRLVLSSASSLVGRVWYVLTCGKCQRKRGLRSEQEQPPPPYTEAIRRNFLSGVPTYNVLECPRLRDAFGISHDFAVRYNSPEDVVRHHEVGRARRKSRAASRRDVGGARATTNPMHAAGMSTSR